ncbi:FixH family protein [Sphaerisporangium sp. NPDC005289]|uniref:FixH family protein n=1 Tax=Sphaerisporangium sp. NPDC005289 TaxID=3155247 RepID=UPI0033A1A136
MSRRSLRAAAAAIIAVTAVAGCAQSRADGNSSPAACQTEKQSAGLTVRFTTNPCPAKGGTAATGQFTIHDSSGAAVTDATVKVNYDMPSMNMRGGEHVATRNGETYESKLVLGMTGYWVVSVQVNRGSGAPATMRFDVRAK